jgi:hypothetical protein
MRRPAPMLAACALGWVAASVAWAQPLREPGEARLHDLESLYAEDAMSNVWNYCVQRDPTSAAAWNTVISRWHGANRAALAELRALDAQLVAAMRAHPAASADLDTWTAIVSARLRLAESELQLLAPLSDEDARRYCDQAQATFAGQTLAADDLAKARAATAAALTFLDRPR